jgi:hypothetical protein
MGISRWEVYQYMSMKITKTSVLLVAHHAAPSPPARKRRMPHGAGHTCKPARFRGNWHCGTFTFTPLIAPGPSLSQSRLSTVDKGQLLGHTTEPKRGKAFVRTRRSRAPQTLHTSGNVLKEAPLGSAPDGHGAPRRAAQGAEYQEPATGLGFQGC